MKKGFFLRLFVLLMLTFFIAEQGRAQTYQRTSQGIKSTVQGINIEEFYKLKYCSTVVYMVPRA